MSNEHVMTLPDHPFYAGIKISIHTETALRLDDRKNGLSVACGPTLERGPWAATVLRGDCYEMIADTPSGRIDEAVLLIRAAAGNCEKFCLPMPEIPMTLEGMALVVSRDIESLPPKILKVMATKLRGVNLKSGKWKSGKMPEKESVAVEADDTGNEEAVD